jgi:hypothetical protein
MGVFFTQVPHRRYLVLRMDICGLPAHGSPTTNLAIAHVLSRPLHPSFPICFVG